MRWENPAEFSTGMQHGCLVEHFPFLDRFVEEPVRVEEGYAYPTESPGHGMRFTPQAAEEHCVESSSSTAG